MRILVTGGAGFIGHHLVRGLLERGDEVRVIDNFATGMRARLEPYLDRLTLIEGSILDPDALDRAMDGTEVVLHEAAIPSVARSLVDPRLSNEVNASGTIEVMLAAGRRSVRRVVLAGSSSVYGIPAELPCRESQRPDPQSPYAASKLAAEDYVHTLGKLHGVETVVLRYFNVFGPGQDPASEYAAVVPRFVTAVLAGRPPTINGNGDISRDFTFVDNVVAANLLAATRPGVTGLTCNVACGSRFSLLELLDAIGDAAGNRVQPEFGPPRAGDIRHSQADITVARAALGYEVAVPFLEGIRRTVAWYRGAGRGPTGTRRGRPGRPVGPSLRSIGPRLLGQFEGSKRFRGLIPHSGILRATLTIVAGSGAAQLIVIATSPIVTRLYSPEDYGIYSVATSVLVLVAVTCLRYDYAIPLPSDDRTAANLLGLSLLVNVGMSLLTCVVLLVAGPWLLGLFGASVLGPHRHPAGPGAIWRRGRIGVPQLGDPNQDVWRDRRQSPDPERRTGFGPDRTRARGLWRHRPPVGDRSWKRRRIGPARLGGVAAARDRLPAGLVGGHGDGRPALPTVPDLLERRGPAGGPRLARTAAAARRAVRAGRRRAVRARRAGVLPAGDPHRGCRRTGLHRR